MTGQFSYQMNPSNHNRRHLLSGARRCLHHQGCTGPCRPSCDDMRRLRAANASIASCMNALELAPAIATRRLVDHCLLCKNALSSQSISRCDVRIDAAAVGSVIRGVDG